MRVLVTGGYGCIGSWIVKNLVERGEHVWIFDTSEDPRRLRQVMEPAAEAKVNFVSGDVTNIKALQETLTWLDISHIIHLAGLQVPVCRSDPLLGAKVNVLGTLAVLEAAKNVRHRLKRLVYASSAAVFGPPEDYGLDEPHYALSESETLRPTTHYGVFKRCNEENARVYHLEHNLPSIGLRPWAVYGVGRDFGMTSEPTKAIKSAVLGRPYQMSFGGKLDLQYVDDVAQTFNRCLQVPFEEAGVFNLRGDVVSVTEFLDALSRVLPAAANLIAPGERQLPIAYDLADDGLQRLGAVPPRTSLEEGIRRTAERFRYLHEAGRLDCSDLPN